MSRTLPAEGTYQARRSGKIIIEETKDEAILAAIPYSLCGTAAFSDVHRVCIVKKDGTVMAKNVDALKKVFGWDGLNFFDLENIDVPEGNAPEFELADCVHEEFIPKATDENPDPQAIMRFKASWFNPLGGRNLAPMADDDRTRLAKKFASKLRALSGAGAKSKTTEEPPAEDPPPKEEETESDEPPPRRSKTTSAMARTSTQQEVWNALEKKHKPKDKKKFAQDVMWKKVDELFGEKDPLTPQEWGKVADALEV
jgi:hypothetical protein